METIVREGYMPNFIGAMVVVFTMGFFAALLIFR